MKLLIILVSLPAIIILAIIVANLRPSFDDKRKGEGSQTSGAARIKFKPAWLIILAALVVGGIFLTKIHPPVAYQIAADAQDLWPSIGETVKVKICPDRWSGWVNCPPGTKATVDAPGEIEYLFLRGERLFFKDKSVKPFDAPSCSFRLRGKTGEAVIAVEPSITIQ